MDQVHCEIYIYIYYDKIYVFFIYNEYKIYFLMHRVYLISFEIFSEIFTLISFKYFLSSKKKTVAQVVEISFTRHQIMVEKLNLFYYI